MDSDGRNAAPGAIMVVVEVTLPFFYSTSSIAIQTNSSRFFFHNLTTAVMAPGGLVRIHRNTM